MKTENAKTSRDDGRSHVQVIVDLVRDAIPGTKFSYDSICSVLSDGSPRQFDKENAQRVVFVSNKKLLKLYQRTLRNVRGEGYKVAYAYEHMDMADARKTKARRQMDMALDLLNHVDWKSMDENQLKAHMAQLALTSAIVNNQRALDARISRIEESIESIKNKSMALEGVGE